MLGSFNGGLFSGSITRWSLLARVLSIAAIHSSVACVQPKNCFTGMNHHDILRADPEDSFVFWAARRSNQGRSTMTIEINDNEVRVLGCFIEKEMTTPEYYPLTMNALITACNQKSNRDPVVAFGETTVIRALDRLRHFGLAMQAGEGVRVSRYRHSLLEKLHLEPEELAVLAELMLRGPQTVGEVRTRAARMHPLESLEMVEAILTALSERDPPLVTQFPRRPGQKECRYTHLLAGKPDPVGHASAPPAESATHQLHTETAKTAALEAEVAILRADLEILKVELADFRKQFD
jgi:uncharacterized protein